MDSSERWTEVARIEGDRTRWPRAWWTSRARPASFALLMAALLAARHGKGIDPVAPSPEAAIAGVLTARGLACEADDVAWVVGPRGVWGSLPGGGKALVRAHEGSASRATSTWSTRASRPRASCSTSATPTTSPTRAASTSRAPSCAGTSPRTRRPPTASTRASTSSTSTGRAVGDVSRLHAHAARAARAHEPPADRARPRGVVHDTYALDPVARARDPRVDAPTAHVEVHADDHVVVHRSAGHARRLGRGRSCASCPTSRRAPATSSRGPSTACARCPGSATTACSGSRPSPSRRSTGGTRTSRTARPRRTCRRDGPAGRARQAPTFTDPGGRAGRRRPSRCPITPPLPGEGQWIALDKDPFITPTPAGTAPAFVTSFVRPNVHRQDVRVYVTLWDPRQIALHMEAGTVEPISANGEHGPGLVPRDAGGDEARRRRLQRRLPGAARRVRHAGQRHRVPAAQAVRRDGRRSCATARTASARGPTRPRRARRRHRVPPEPHGARRARQVQPVGPQLVGRHAAGLARPDPQRAQRHLPHEGRLRRLLLQREHLAPRTSRRGCSTRAAPTASTST